MDDSTRESCAVVRRGGAAGRRSVGVVIVNWNGGADLAECIATLRAPGEAVVDEIIVVDNASSDDSLARLGDASGITIIRSGANLGFAAGVNLGVAHARGEVLVLVNPDVRIDPDAIATVIQYLDTHADVGIAGPLLYDGAGCWQPSSGRLGVAGHLLLDTRLFRRRPRRSRRVGWIHGAVMALRRDLFRELGGFDERLFMYGEDMDLCARARARGYATAVVVEARALHYGNRSGRLRFGDARDAEVLKAEMRVFAGRVSRWGLALFRLLGGFKYGVKSAARWAAGDRRGARRAWELAGICWRFVPRVPPGGARAVRDGSDSDLPPVGACVSVAIPCRVDEPALGMVIDEVVANCRRAGFLDRVGVEILVCVNGARRDGEAAPRRALRERCAAHAIPLEETWVDDGEASRSRPLAVGSMRARLLLTPLEGKARAWNVLRAAATGAPMFVCDADVIFSPDAFAKLDAGLRGAPDLAVCSPKTDCRHDGSVLERVIAAPYRFDFPNLSGQLYAMWPSRVPAHMPEDLIEPERWLELAVGPERVGRDPTARVYVRLTATLADFFRQRVRIEMGKLQIARVYPELLARSRPQPGAAAAWRLSVRERLRLGAYLALRTVAQAWAWWRYRPGGFDGIWRQPRTTKIWRRAAV
jgi:hypothetical protein